MFACIFVPNFPVAAVFRAEPELRDAGGGYFRGQASAGESFCRD